MYFFAGFGDITDRVENIVDKLLVREIFIGEINEKYDIIQV